MSIDHSYIGSEASRLLQESFNKAGYKSRTVEYLSNALGEWVSDETDWGSSQIKLVSNQLLPLLDSEPNLEIEQDQSEDN
jgi:hypothetical protein